MSNDKALRLALVALQRFIKYDYNGNPFDGKDVEGAEAITAIKAALAQPEQEPVGFVDSKLNPIQRTWVGLTNEERKTICNFSQTTEWAISMTQSTLKEKNNG